MNGEIGEINIENYSYLFTVGDFNDALCQTFTYPIINPIFQNVGKKTNVYIQDPTSSLESEPVIRIKNYRFKETFKGAIEDFIKNTKKLPSENGILIRDISSERIDVYNFNPKKI